MPDCPQMETSSDPNGGDDGTDPATATSKKWYCYLGLRLRLQQGELPHFGEL